MRSRRRATQGRLATGGGQGRPHPTKSQSHAWPASPGRPPARFCCEPQEEQLGCWARRAEAGGDGRRQGCVIDDAQLL